MPYGGALQNRGPYPGQSHVAKNKSEVQAMYIHGKLSPSSCVPDSVRTIPWGGIQPGPGTPALRRPGGASVKFRWYPSALKFVGHRSVDSSEIFVSRWEARHNSPLQSRTGRRQPPEGARANTPCLHSRLLLGRWSTDHKGGKGPRPILHQLCGVSPAPAVHSVLSGGFPPPTTSKTAPTGQTTTSVWLCLLGPHVKPPTVQPPAASAGQGGPATAPWAPNNKSGMHRRPQSNLCRRRPPRHANSALHRGAASSRPSRCAPQGPLPEGAEPLPVLCPGPAPLRRPPALPRSTRVASRQGQPGDPRLRAAAAAHQPAGAEGITPTNPAGPGMPAIRRKRDPSPRGCLTSSAQRSASAHCGPVRARPGRASSHTWARS
ncbi:hypothetical protein NDU88_003849 [Pleurodeles waltl]|uniref:Uncharacterized protein n=1 Tax=Pleurodeles waltl TaxID=8319 RepID=A0AAV7TQV9_PLEWA|nr:hypothetical protein NDU88_003849 [Pleurodeles waltl]